MRKCTKSPGAIECEELDHDGVQLEACYCSSDLCNKDQACSCGLKCQTCLGQNGYCDDPENNGVASYCLKTESCAYIHLRKAFLNSKLYFTVYILFSESEGGGLSVSRRCEEIPPSGETCIQISEHEVRPILFPMVDVSLTFCVRKVDTSVTVMNQIAMPMINVNAQ